MGVARGPEPNSEQSRRHASHGVVRARFSTLRLGSTRRDVLAALLGVPAALAAGCNRAVNHDFAGEIVGASEGVGHRLRDGLKVEVPSDRWQDAGVVIVGGGVAGLAAAWRFLRAGFDDFVLLELESSPGGTSRSGQSRMLSFPWGAHYIPAPMQQNRALVSLLDEMHVLEGPNADGEPVVAEEFLCRDPQERIFFKGRWYEGLYHHAGASREDLNQLNRFMTTAHGWVGWRDPRGRRAFALPLAKCSDAAAVTELDSVSMDEWLGRHGFTSARLRWLVNYACRDDYGLTLENTSAWAGLFYFAARVAQPGSEPQPLITWPEGNGRLVSHLFGKAKAKVRLEFAVADIVPTERDGEAGVDVMAVDHAGQSAIGFHARQVVFAAPSFLSRFLIRPFRADPPLHLNEFHYGAWMVANVFLKDRPGGQGFPLAWDNVFYESPSLGYVVATHQRGLDHGPTVFTYYYPLCDANPRVARSKLQAADWSQWTDVVLADLARAHPGITSLIERIDVMRWGHAMIQPRPGFIWGRDRLAAARPFRGIHFAHSDLSGVALFEEAFYQGIRAAEEVLTFRGRQDESIL